MIRYGEVLLENEEKGNEGKRERQSCLRKNRTRCEEKKREREKSKDRKEGVRNVLGSGSEE